MLFPGFGTGNLYKAVTRYCTPGEGIPAATNWEYPLPDCVGVEKEAQYIDAFEQKSQDASVEVQQSDFLLNPPDGEFDWVVMNPPYTRYNNLPAEKRDRYRELFDTTSGRFPLYAPFVEQALELTTSGGWVVAILPVSALTRNSAKPLQELLSRRSLGPILFLPPQTFDRKVETILIGIKNEQELPTPAPPEHDTDGGPRSTFPFWVEPVHAYSGATRKLLQELGVDDTDSGMERYLDLLRSYQSSVRKRALEMPSIRNAMQRAAGSAHESETTRQSSIPDQTSLRTFSQ